MGGSIGLIPPSLKFKPHAGIRRFNVLVYINEFGNADGRDHLAAKYVRGNGHSDSSTASILKALFTISFSSKLMMQDTIGHCLARY
jgi:hypothetical protein